jgi:predicted phosphoadenosine phosphosulfate sulfurtransferase
MAKLYTDSDHSPRQGKKQFVAENVYQLSLARLRLCFDRFDKVVVTFSGGKDSTVCFQLALQVAMEFNRLPLDVVTFDEEAIPPETVEYMERVATNPDIRFHWYCLPVKHRNACSIKSPDWYPWADEDKKVWVRDLPPLAITELLGFNRQPTQDTIGLIFGPQFGTVCNVMGIRTQESLMRYGCIARKRGFESFLSPCFDVNGRHMTKAYPIYDWNTDDVWLAPHLFGWDHNRAYDKMEAAGLHRLEARCSPPYGEQPIRRLWSYKTCWPDLWARMVDRVPGAATAARYANTDLYGIGETVELLTSESWRSRVQTGLLLLTQDSRIEVAKCIKHILADHARRTGDMLPDDAAHPQSGFSWKMCHRLVMAGGNKFGRQLMKVRALARKNRVREKNVAL